MPEPAAVLAASSADMLGALINEYQRCDRVRARWVPQRRHPRGKRRVPRQRMQPPNAGGFGAGKPCT